MADCGIGGVVSGGITVRCRHIHITVHGVHGKGDAFCLVVLTCGQGGRPTVKHFAIGHCGLVQRHGHFCAFRYIVGRFAGGCVSVAVQLAGHIAAVVFHSNSAAGHGQRVVDRSIGVKLPTGMEGDVLRNCGFFHIKELVIVGVPAGELVTRTGGSIDGIQIGCFQFVCLGTNDFFGLINRHLRVVGLAAIGIKGHMAEAKKIAFCQYRIFKQIICVVPVVVEVDGTIGSVNIDRSTIGVKNVVSVFVLFVSGSVETPSRTMGQLILERGQPGRKRNVFQTKAPVKGIRFNGCYVFRDGDGLEL